MVNMRITTNYKKLFQKIGLAGAYESSTVNSPVDREKDRDAAFSIGKVEIENVGTTREKKPHLTIRTPSLLDHYSPNNNYYSTQRTWKASNQEPEYITAKYKTTFNLKTTALDFFDFGKRFFDVQSNDFFKPFVNRLHKFYKNDSDNWKELYNNSNDYSYGRMPRSPIPYSVKFQANNQSITGFDISGTYKRLGFGFNDLPFARISFPYNGNETKLFAQHINQSGSLNYETLTPFSQRESTGFTAYDFNPSRLSGISGIFGSGSGTPALSILNRFQGRNSIKNTNYILASQGLINSLNSGFLNVSSIDANKKYYIPYPNTCDKTFFYPSKVPTKICFVGNQDHVLKIDGLIVVSTGKINSAYSKICYVSPHKINPLTANTIQNFYKRSVKSFISGSSIRRISGFEKTEEIFQVNILNINSNYYNGFGLPENSGDWNASNLQYSNFLGIGQEGLTTDEENIFGYSGTLFPDELVGVHRYLTITNDAHLQQATPLKDTPFYKFYSGLYTGYKTFNTGTWDGIIPSGTQISVELISTTLNSNAGTNLNGVLVYSGHGTADAIDLKIYKSFHPEHSYYLLRSTKMEEEDGEFSYTAYGTANDPSEAVSYAKHNSNRKISKILFKLLKTNVPEILTFNRKYNKLKKFQSLLKAKQINSGIYDYIPNDYKV